MGKIAGNGTHFRPHLNCRDPDVTHDYAPPAFRWTSKASDTDFGRLRACHAGIFPHRSRRFKRLARKFLEALHGVGWSRAGTRYSWPLPSLASLSLGAAGHRATRYSTRRSTRFLPSGDSNVNDTTLPALSSWNVTVMPGFD